MDTPLLAPDDGETPPSLSNGLVSQESDENEGLLSRLSGRSDTDIPVQQPEQLVIEAGEDPGSKAFFIIASGSLILIHIGFVWGSYLVSSWSDTYVFVKVSWLDSTVESLVQSIDLGTFMSVLFQAQQYLHVIFFAFAGLVLPVLAMVVHSVRIIQHQLDLEDQNGGRQFRWLELSLRFALLVVYAMSFLDLSTTFELQWTGTNIAVASRWRGGLVAFMGGTSASFVVVSLFRRREALVFQNHRLGDGNDGRNCNCAPSKKRRFLAWELGLMALILLVPATTLPVMSISYSGLAAKFMPSSTKRIYLSQFPVLLWEHGFKAGTQLYMLTVGVALSVFHVAIAPTVALIVGLNMWWNEGTMDSASMSRRRLIVHCLHPHVNSITFSFALVCMGISLSQVGHVLLDNDAYGLCEKMNNLVGEPCLDVSSQLLGGAWFYVAQSVALEIFLSFTFSAF